MAVARVVLASAFLLTYCFSLADSTQQTFNLIRSAPGGHAEVIFSAVRRKYAQLLPVNRRPVSLKRRFTAPAASTSSELVETRTYVLLSSCFPSGP